MAVASELLPQGVTGEQLSQLEDAWLPLLQPFPWDQSQAEGLRLRGRILFGVGARLLGSDPQPTEAVGELWSLFDGAQYCSDRQSRSFLIDEARRLDLPRRALTSLRPLTVLAALAIADIRDPSSGIARGMAALRHRLTGRFPRL